MFVFSLERFNYTQARNFCRNQNASLAHVISEERTEGLGKFVSRDLPSFVGLSNNDKERIWKNEFGKVRENFDFFTRQERVMNSKIFRQFGKTFAFFLFFVRRAPVLLRLSSVGCGRTVAFEGLRRSCESIVVIRRK